MSSPDDDETASVSTFCSPPRNNASSERHKTDRGESLIIRADVDDADVVVVNNTPLPV